MRFFIDERSGPRKGIRLTDEVRRIHGGIQGGNLPLEVDARWRLVETAWQLKIPVSAVRVTYDSGEEMFVVEEEGDRRRNITGCRDALNGYQKGHCFYCFAPITILSSNEDLADVDHFIPHRLRRELADRNVDGVWNLVLACKNCNRGVEG